MTGQTRHRKNLTPAIARATPELITAEGYQASPPRVLTKKLSVLSATVCRQLKNTRQLFTQALLTVSAYLADDLIKNIPGNATIIEKSEKTAGNTGKTRRKLS